MIKPVTRDGAWTNYEEIALEHVEEQRNLVDGVLTDELANLGDTRGVVDIALHFPLAQLLGAQILAYVVGIGDHAAELKHADHPAPKAMSNVLLHMR